MENKYTPQHATPTAKTELIKRICDMTEEECMQILCAIATDVLPTEETFEEKNNIEAPALAAPRALEPSTVTNPLSPSNPYFDVVNSYLTKYGFKFNLKGFAAIRTMLILILQKGNPALAMMPLYTLVANALGSTSNRVQRAIRTAIQGAYRSNPDSFADFPKLPANNNFIAHAYLELQNELTKKNQ